MQAWDVSAPQAEKKAAGDGSWPCEWAAGRGVAALGCGAGPGFLVEAQARTPPQLALTHGYPEG